MLVFYEKRLALLSVPKTGSTAYQTALRDRADIVVSGPTDLKHANMRRYDRFFQTMFRKMFDTEMDVMAIVREPVDWLGSWYRYRSRPELANHPHSTRNLSFEAFLNAYMQDPRPAFADVGCQTEFLLPRSNSAGVTHIFKYENQNKILEFLQKRLECSIDLPRENVSPDGPMDLSTETQQRFHSLHAAEFALHQSAE
ncbi:gamma-glutamyl kinase [Ruegeria sp. ANG-R]|uniref:sulfotransferase family 2 domain-containing protein n=1 Tax=Ruegeria sp. ANG-R TaxID=1577903 RepID=UPI00057CF536|nr:sulfotransferase family 2 domain-containing protein [Ruegeria sp. ANG-R]KIC42789.1 gamma-glutamyl kinase [Ruegeria sp. ANG-R]